MALERGQHLKLQTAVWWPVVGLDAYGQPRRGDPVEVDVRWLSQQRDMMDARGNVISYDATAVFTAPVAVGDVIWLGRLADFVEARDGKDLMVISGAEDTLPMHGGRVRRTRRLKRFRSNLPPTG